jgi:DNA-binding MarR family transcriptional regulator
MLHTTDRLEALGLVVRVPDPRGCAPGFRHTMREAWSLEDAEFGVLIALMRLGPMESSEITVRLQAGGTEVNHRDVVGALRRLEKRDRPLAARLTRPLHQKERIWTQLVGDPRHPVFTRGAAGCREYLPCDTANPIRGGSHDEQVQELRDLIDRYRRLIRQHRGGPPPDDFDYY